MTIDKERFEHVQDYIRKVMEPYWGQHLTQELRTQVEHELTEALKVLELTEYEVVFEHDGYDIRPKRVNIGPKKVMTIQDWVPMSSVPDTDPDDILIVTLDGVMMGLVIEADVEKGYVIQKLRSDGSEWLVTKRGTVEITFNGKPAFRVERDK